MKLIYKLATKVRNAVLSFPGYIDVTDEYIRHLLLVNPGLLHKGNLYCFRYAVQHLKSTSPIIEIGAFCGLSTNVMNYYLQRAKKKNTIYSCDPWKYGFVRPNSLGAFSVSESEFNSFVRETYIRNTNLFGKPRISHGFQILSNDFFKLWDKKQVSRDITGRLVKLGGKISFCYIDGDHSYKQAKKDFENVGKYLEKGGFLFFDDSAPYSGCECADLMNEILNNKNYKLIIKNPNFLFQKVI